MINKHWKIKSSETKFKGDWIDLHLEKVELPDGKLLNYEAAKYHRGGTGVVAQNDTGKFMLIKSYRYINDYYGWEVPAGTVPPDQSLEDCIIQELKEEAGCEVKKESLKYLGNYYPSIGSSNQLFHCFFANGVIQSYPHTDTNEVIETRWFTRDEILNLMETGEIKDGFSITLLLLVFNNSKLTEKLYG